MAIGVKEVGEVFVVKDLKFSTYDRSKFKDFK